MANLSELVFRKITPADFFNINKQRGMENRGGGQSYIDFPVKYVDLNTWHSFFSDIKPKAKQSGPLWAVKIDSLGCLGKQDIEIGQRRKTTVSIRSQKLLSIRSKRVLAWHPDHSEFPRAPKNISSARDPRVIKLAAGVRIFILKTDEGDYWAGWFRTKEIKRLAVVDARFKKMLIEPAGHLSFDPVVEFDVTSQRNPFGARVHAATYNMKPGQTEEDIAKELFQDDNLSEETSKSERVIRARRRNVKAARELKRLYNACQITGDKFVFPKIDGKPYVEVHHLVPLGKGGSDKPKNLIVVSAHMHRMLHYAVVEGIDLSKIIDNKLDFKINGKKFTITWHPEHAKVINEANGVTG